MTQAVPTTDVLTVDSITGWYNALKSARHCYVAYSGGLDSHVLLHLVSQLLPADKITALHINHQLSPNSSDWAEHCRNICASLNIPIIVETATVVAEGEGIEAAARKARYHCFDKHLQSGDLLLQAHHTDDQVETVLYRLLRGSGVKGLAGIPQTRGLGEGQLIRPLLPFTRAQLEVYAQSNGLQWIDDESNDDSRFDRNFLRNELFPLIEQRWPDYRQRICLSATLASRSAELDQICAEEDLRSLGCRTERVGWSIEIYALLSLSEIRQRNVIRYWIEQHRLPVPGHKILETLFTEFLTARQDATPLLSWPGAECRRYQQRLYLLPPSKEARLETELTVFIPEMTYPLPGGGTLRTVSAKGEGLRYQSDMQLHMCFRQGGERCEPAGRGSSNTLKKLFQEYQLEPWLRDRTPLIYLNGELAAVGDMWVCEGFQAGENERGLKFEINY